MSNKRGDNPSNLSKPLEPSNHAYNQFTAHNSLHRWAILPYTRPPRVIMSILWIYYSATMQHRCFGIRWECSWLIRWSLWLRLGLRIMHQRNCDKSILLCDLMEHFFNMKLYTTAACHLAASGFVRGGILVLGWVMISGLKYKYTVASDTLKHMQC